MEYDEGAYRWVANGPRPEQWVRAYFSPHVKCDILCNNLCESFNGHILDARCQPIIGLIEGIKELVMCRIQHRKIEMMKQPEDGVCPIIRNRVEATALESRKWKPVWNGCDGYQVRGPKDQQFIVDLKKMNVVVNHGQE